MAETIAQLQARADKFVKDRPGGLNAAQKASLAKLNKRISTLLVAEAAAPVTPVPTGARPIDIGPEPYPNNATGQLEGQYYNCPADVAAFAANYGVDIQTLYNRVATGLLRPVGKTAHDATRQRAALDYFDGKAPFEFSIGNYIGPTWGRYLGCVVIHEIHDLGAG
jgi:hypothetical protein